MKDLTLEFLNFLEKPVSDKKQILTYYAFNEPALNGFSKELSETRDGKNGYFVEFTKEIETLTHLLTHKSELSL